MSLRLQVHTWLSRWREEVLEVSRMIIWQVKELELQSNSSMTNLLMTIHLVVCLQEFVLTGLLLIATMRARMLRTAMSLGILSFEGLLPRESRGFVSLGPKTSSLASKSHTTMISQKAMRREWSVSSINDTLCVTTLVTL